LKNRIDIDTIDVIKHFLSTILIYSREKKADRGGAARRKRDDVSLLGGQWRAGGNNSPEDLFRGAV